MVTLYTTGCPKCKVLKKKLELAGIEFKAVDNMDEIMKACEKAGTTSVPLLGVDNNVLTFGAAAQWINNGGQTN